MYNTREGILRDWSYFRKGNTIFKWAASSEKSASKYVQKVRIHIILHMRKVSSGPLLSIHTLCSIQCFCWWTVKTVIRLRGCAGWSGPSLSAFARKQVFAWRGLIGFASLLQRIQGNLMAPTSLFILDMGSSSHWGLIIAAGQEANGGCLFGLP